MKAVDQLIAKDKELQAAIKQVQEQQARQHEIQRTREEISKKDQEILNLESQLKEAEKILVSEEATGLNNVCACAACHGARSLGITTSRIKMAPFSKFCEWPPVFRQKGEFA